jgi:MYND finger
MSADIDANDPQKYIIRRGDFRRLPRWKDDGIERYQKEEGQEFDTETMESVVTAIAASPLERDLASLLGNWVYQSNLEDDPDSRDMILSLPGSMQIRAATEQLNLEAAQQHLIQAYQNRGSVAYDILGQIGYRPAIFKASKDMRRFPDWKYLIAKILQMSLGTDTNVKHLFGEVSHVRGILLQVGQIVAEPPPPNSPAYAIWHPILNQDDKAARVKPTCAYCDKEEGENGSSKKMAKCLNCKSVHYCSRDCQRTHWPVHKPDCLEKQGKPVPDNVHQKAAATLAKWERDKNEQKQAEETQFYIQLQQAFQDYRTEPPPRRSSNEDAMHMWSHDCHGKRRRHDFPAKNTENLFRLLVGYENDNLKFEEEIELGMFPLGMEGLDQKTRGLGFLLTDKVSTGKIIVLYERLFADRGNGAYSGIGIVGAYVVDRSAAETDSRGKKVQKGVWKKVDEPTPFVVDHASGGGGAVVVWNRYQWVVSYLERARALAKAFPESVDLGIHDVKAQMDAMKQIETPFGTYMKHGGRI